MKKSTSSKGVQKWTSLFHYGVIVPKPYTPHGVKMLYKGSPVDLSPEQEEVATLYAEMLDYDHYMNDPKFRDNFMGDWRKILGVNHIIQSLEHCDFMPIYQWHQRRKIAKKKASKDKRLEKLKELANEKQMWAIADGVKMKVENFRVGSPGLFRGHDHHKQNGKLKRRIRPSDITINIGEDAPIPDCPFPGESWKKVSHDKRVTWLACWEDPMDPKKKIYAFLDGLREKAKFEKTRLLKNNVQGIRAAYTNDFTSDDMAKRQFAVATYFIDKLSLRAGNEKDRNGGETLACCILKVGDLELVPPNILKFDYKCEDSIQRYQNDVEVETAAFEAIQQFRNGKNGGDFLFDKLGLRTLKAHLKSLMPGLTATVFRSFNASITMDDILNKVTFKGANLAEAAYVYHLPRNRVEIICNHKRTSVRKLCFNKSSQRSQIRNLSKCIEELKIDGMECDEETKKERMRKTSVFSTSKISDIDPRIIVAWCKLNEVPVEKLWNKCILAKHAWAVVVDPGFRF